MYIPFLLFNTRIVLRVKTSQNFLEMGVSDFYGFFFNIIVLYTLIPNEFISLHYLTLLVG